MFFTDLILKVATKGDIETITKKAYLGVIIQVSNKDGKYYQENKELFKPWLPTTLTQEKKKEIERELELGRKINLDFSFKETEPVLLTEAEILEHTQKLNEYNTEVDTILKSVVITDELKKAVSKCENDMGFDCGFTNVYLNVKVNKVEMVKPMLFLTHLQQLLPETKLRVTKAEKSYSTWEETQDNDLVELNSWYEVCLINDLVNCEELADFRVLVNKQSITYKEVAFKYLFNMIRNIIVQELNMYTYFEEGIDKEDLRKYLNQMFVITSKYD